MTGNRGSGNKDGGFVRKYAQVIFLTLDAMAKSLNMRGII